MAISLSSQCFGSKNVSHLLWISRLCDIALCFSCLQAICRCLSIWRVCHCHCQCHDLMVVSTWELFTSHASNTPRFVQTTTFGAIPYHHDPSRLIEAWSTRYTLLQMGCYSNYLSKFSGNYRGRKTACLNDVLNHVSLWNDGEKHRECYKWAARKCTVHPSWAHRWSEEHRAKRGVLHFTHDHCT